MSAERRTGRLTELLHQLAEDQVTLNFTNQICQFIFSGDLHLLLTSPDIKAQLHLKAIFWRQALSFFHRTERRKPGRPHTLYIASKPQLEFFLASKSTKRKKQCQSVKSSRPWPHESSRRKFTYQVVSFVCVAEAAST